MNFNYIIPIFNKQDLILEVLEGICSINKNPAKIITVIDGCTDQTEKRIDQFAKHSPVEIVKVFEKNVHMLRSINSGMSLVNSGHLVLMQDDIVLKDQQFEQLILETIDNYANRIGVISCRYGSDIGYTSIKDSIRKKVIGRMITEENFIKNKCDHADHPEAEHHIFTPKMNAINGPNVITDRLFSRIGALDANLAPFGYDDPEYCIRSLMSGFINGILPVDYVSDLHWGGTRRSQKFANIVSKIHKRNRRYIYKKHAVFLKEYIRTHLNEEMLY